MGCLAYVRWWIPGSEGISSFNHSNRLPEPGQTNQTDHANAIGTKQTFQRPATIKSTALKHFG